MNIYKKADSIYLIALVHLSSENVNACKAIGMETCSVNDSPFVKFVKQDMLCGTIVEYLLLHFMSTSCLGH